ncbi:MAG TPA: DUF3100 domain-containing protein [Firmicutes bacterium]|nr:DUF3100 domain-containing protein [Bacillota bacterium]
MRGKSELKVHLLALVMVIIAEFIGIKRFQVGPGTVLLLPMLYALVIGMFLPVLRLVDRRDMDTASPFIGFAVMYLTAKMGTNIGPNLPKILSAGPALILQEFGNLGTILLSLPVAILVFRMGREAVGTSFSISREGSLAIVADLYGLDSAEGRGVMGGYITGTLFGAIFNGLMVGFLVATGIFHPFSLAMAAGTGSASMMAAALGPVVAAYPEINTELTAYAASSQLLTSVDGLYMSLFLGIPFTEWLYRKLGGKPAEVNSNSAQSGTGHKGGAKK